MPVTRLPPPVQPEETKVTEPVTAELLSMQSSVGLPLEGTPAPSQTNVENAPVERGSTIGRYVVLHEVGRGGMGVVYAAYDAELDRKVAIKVLRSTSGNAARDHDRQARLLREAQAMARIEHPNVLSVFDVGTFRNQVFVAMAFVDGTNLSEYIRDRKHTWQETLALFLDAGRGLAAAHAVGLVHRDFKPANVLLARDGRVYVTDFGLARLTGHEEPDSLPSAFEEQFAEGAPRTGLQAEMTREGAVVGTPTYMAPEQHVGQQANARSDQFSFCAALYWALWHQRPFDPSLLAAAAFRRMGGKGTVPQRAASGGESEVSVIAEPPREGRVLAKVQRAVMRGLSLDPEDRFESMEALLDQLSLERRQTQARWAAAGVGALLAIAITGGTWQWVERRRAGLCSGAQARLRGTWDDSVEQAIRTGFQHVAADRGAVEAERATRALGDYAAKWAAGFREACEATRLRGEHTEETLSLRMICLEKRLKELDALTHLMQSPDETMVDKAVAAATNLSSIRQCQEPATLHLMGRPDDPARGQAVQQVEAQLAQVRALKAAGRLKAAKEIARQAVAAAEPLHYRPVEAEARLLLGWLEGQMGMMQASEKELSDAFFAAEAGQDDYTKVQAATRLVYQLRDRREKALEWARHAQNGLARTGNSPELEVALLTNLSAVHNRSGHYAEALSVIQQGLAVVDRTGGREVHRVELLVNLGAVYTNLGDREKAVATIRQVLEAMTAMRGPNHPAQVTPLRNLAIVLAQQGDFHGAYEAADRALTISRERLGAQSPQVAQSLDVSGTVLLMDHHPEEALEKFRQAAEIKTKALGADTPDVGYSLDNAGQALVALGRPKEALQSLEKATRLLAAEAPELLAEAQYHLAQALIAAHQDLPRARALAQQARSGFLVANMADRAQEVTRWLSQSGALRR